MELLAQIVGDIEMMKSINERLDTRVNRFSTVDLKRIIENLFGVGSYVKLISTLDREALNATSTMRKGTTETSAQLVADQRLRLALDMQEARRYRKTKLGKLESQYLPIVHQLRTSADRPMSWPNVVRFLKIKHRFSVSQPYLCRVYDAWRTRLNDGGE